MDKANVQAFWPCVQAVTINTPKKYIIPKHWDLSVNVRQGGKQEKVPEGGDTFDAPIWRR